MAVGQVLTSFNANSTVTATWADYIQCSLVLGANVIVGGKPNSVSTALEKFSATGAADTAWNPPDLGGGTVLSLADAGSGKVAVGGRGLVTNRSVMLLNADGSNDTGFSESSAIDLTTTPNYVSVAVQPDGKVLVGGNFAASATAYGVIRLNTDGTRDNSFAAVDAGIQTVRRIALQPDGKVLVGGQTNVGAVIARLNSDGTIDSGFTPPAALTTDKYVTCITRQSDGKILVGLGKTGGGLTSETLVYRLNADGTSDAGFTPVTLGVGAEQFSMFVNELVPQGDGKILVCGWFDTIAGLECPVMARINATGTADTAYDPTPALTRETSDVNTVSLFPDGSIFVGGWFTSYGGVARNHIALLENDYVVTVTVPTEAITEGLVLASSPVAGMIMAIQEAIAAAAASTASAETANYIAESLIVLQRAHPVLLQLISEGLAVGDTLTDDYTAIVAVLDRLVLEGTATNYADARNMVVDALVLIAVSETLSKETMHDTAAFGVVVESLFTAMQYIVDTAALRADASGSMLLTALMRENATFGTLSETSATLGQLVREAVSFAMHLSVDNQQYVAWSMNTRNQGLTRYTQYPYNSFAKLGGRYFGLTSTGLYELTGDDDAGTPVPARIRLGMFDFGTRRFKRVPEVYIGYAATGDLLLRAISVDAATGEKHAATYRVQPRSAAVTRESKFKLGAGVKSVDWDFELENINGADFDLSTIVFHPLRTDRRTRG